MIEKTILRNLIQNEPFTRAVLPYIKEEYFGESEDRNAFIEVRDFILKYNSRPTYEALRVEVEAQRKYSEPDVRSLHQLIDDFEKDSALPPNFEWLLENTEKFCQDRALYLALLESVKIANNSASGVSKGSIPGLLSEALSISFDPDVGHDYTEDFDHRFEYYHRIEARLAFDLDYFNRATKGGIPSKTLNIILGGTGAGKSLFLCHFAASYLAQGKKVLYITLELAEEEVAKRIDANLMNVTFDRLMAMDKSGYTSSFINMKNKTDGRLIIKEYPTASANVNNFRALLNELRLKKRFVPDVVIVDYLNICTSARIKPGSNTNSYTYVKSIAEELRGFAVEHNVVLWSATQTTRSGYTNSDAGLEDTSESFGLPATADFMFLIYAGDELKQLNQIMVKQLKSRYDDIMKLEKFNVGVDKSKMKLYDLEEAAQIDMENYYMNRSVETGTGQRSPQERPPATTLRSKKW